MNDEQRTRVLNANVAFHSALAKTYDGQQPHFRPENVRRVERILTDLAARTGGGRLLDIGCGTGFILNLAKRYFRQVVGIDATAAMLLRVERSGGRVGVCLGDTGALPFPTGSFDACTAYGFLHHLYDVRETLAEAARCLRPGGVFYSDGDPHRPFWRRMSDLQGLEALPPVVAREVRSVVAITEDISADIGLAASEIALAEFQKVQEGGFDAAHLREWFDDAGFAEVVVRPEWFLGQGVWLQHSEGSVAVIEDYLRSVLPASDHFFKYVSITATRRPA